MRKPALERGPTVTETIDRWTRRTVSRIGAHSPKPFDHRLFLKQFWEDHPGDPRAEDFAATFTAAVASSHGNTERFRKHLQRELTMVRVKWNQ